MSSCSNEDEYDYLYGTWKHVDNISVTLQYVETFTITKDNVVNRFYSGPYNYYDRMSNGEWEVKNDILYLYFDDRSVELSIKPRHLESKSGNKYNKVTKENENPKSITGRSYSKDAYLSFNQQAHISVNFIDEHRVRIVSSFNGELQNTEGRYTYNELFGSIEFAGIIHLINGTHFEYKNALVKTNGDLVLMINDGKTNYNTFVTRDN